MTNRDHLAQPEGFEPSCPGGQQISNLPVSPTHPKLHESEDYAPRHRVGFLAPKDVPSNVRRRRGEKPKPAPFNPAPGRIASG